MITAKHTVLFVLIFVLISSSLYTQSVDVKMEYVSTDQGLSHPHVHCVLEDSYGFLWIGTDDGLNRYDGYEFLVYKNDMWDTTSLTSPIINLLKEDDNGNIWVGTPNGLNFYRRQTDSFVHYTHDPKKKYSITAKNNIDALVIDQNNSKYIWFGAKGGGLNLFDSELERFYSFKHEQENHNSLSGNNVQSLFQDSFGNLWVGTSDSGLNRIIMSSISKTRDGKYDPSKFSSLKFERFVKNRDTTAEFNPQWVHSFYEDRSNRLWILGDTQVLTFDRQRNELMPLPYTFNNVNHFHEMLEDHRGDYWFGAHNRVFQLNTQTNTIKDYLINKVGTRSGGNQGLCEDKAGNIWVATWDGIVRMHQDQSLFKKYYHNVEDPSLPASNYMYSILTDHLGKIWIGTYTGLLLMTKNVNGSERFINYSKNHQIEGSVNALVEDDNGFIWAVIGYSLVRIDPNTNSIVQYKNDPKNSNALSFQKKRGNAGSAKLFIDGADNLWISAWTGGISKVGLDDLYSIDNLRNVKFTNYFSGHDDPFRSIIYFIQDRSGIFWICTNDAGVIKFNPDTEAFNNYKQELNNPNSLSFNYTTSVYEDNKGNIWVGTYGGGINKLDRRTETFTRIGMKNGLTSDIIRGILGDDNSNLWISTNSGISKYNHENNRIRNYDMEENKISFQDTLTGKIYFGNDQGFNVFHPDSIKESSYVPSVVLTKFIRFSDETDAKQIVDHTISAKDNIELSYNDDIISFEFAALSFDPNNICKYAYKLEGLTNNWINLGSKREITFSNLAPGDYIFKVRACNADGKWCDKPASIQIYISPPWWATWWAYTIYGTLLIGVLFSVRKFEINRKEEKTKLREAVLKAKIIETEKRTLEIENERNEKELEQAKKLQLSMLPKDIPSLPNLDIAAYMKTAAQVGGDYYDFYTSEDGTLNVVIGDATGHGIDACMMVSVSKGLFQNLASCANLEEFINQFNYSLQSMNLQPMYMTLRILRIKDSHLEVIGAGMYPFLIYEKATGIIKEIESSGPPLGVFTHFNYAKQEYKLARGDVMFLMTDGFTERINNKNEMIGDDRAKNILDEVCDESANEIIKRFVKECDKWGGDIPPNDDVTFVVIKAN